MGCLCNQARSQEFALGGGGLFWILDETSNDLDPDFNRSLIGLSRFFRPKTGCLQKKSLHPNPDSVSDQLWVRSKKNKTNSSFVVQITASPSQLLLTNPFGESIFNFGAKIGLKSTKNVVFCILLKPMREARAPRPLATVLFVTVNLHMTK